MCKLKNPMGRLGRLFHRLQGVEYELICLPGDQTFLPNFLSRAVEPENVEAKANMIELRSSIDWKVEQAKDAEVAQVVGLVRLVSENAPEVSWAVLKESLFLFWSFLTFISSLVFFVCFS